MPDLISLAIPAFLFVLTLEGSPMLSCGVTSEKSRIRRQRHQGIGNVLVATKSKWGIHFMQVTPTGWGFRFQQEHKLDD